LSNINTNDKNRLTLKHKLYHLLLVAIIIFLSAQLIHEPLYRNEAIIGIAGLMSHTSWHNLLELISVLISFSIFIVAYNAYKQTRKIKTFITGCLMLSACLLNIFHMLGYLNMPGFLMHENDYNRSLTLQAFAQLVSAVAFFLYSIIKPDKTSNINRRLFIAFVIVLPVALLLLATYCPEVLPAFYDNDKHSITMVNMVFALLVIIIMSVSAVNFYLAYLRERSTNTLILCFAMIFGIFAEGTMLIYRNVYDIYSLLGHILKAISYFLLFRSLVTRYLQMPYEELEKSRKLLRRHTENLDRFVNIRTMQLKRTNKKLTADLEYAREIQRAMLPSSSSYVLNNFSFNSEYMPADKISGDFYDRFKIDDQHVGFYIADVAGHGVSAAMLTLYIKQCIESRRTIDKNSDLISFPSVVIKYLFDAFNGANFKVEIYFVILYAILNIETGRMILCSAGMNTTPVLIKPDGEIKEIQLEGLPICKLKDVLEFDYVDTFLNLEKGDKMFFYTDGLVDAQNIDKERYSEKRLYNVLASNCKEPGEVIRRKVTEDLKEFIGEKKIKDDITFFVIEI